MRTLLASQSDIADSVPDPYRLDLKDELNDESNGNHSCPPTADRFYRSHSQNIPRFDSNIQSYHNSLNNFDYNYDNDVSSVEVPQNGRSHTKTSFAQQNHQPRIHHHSNRQMNTGKQQKHQHQQQGDRGRIRFRPRQPKPPPRSLSTDTVETEITGNCRTGKNRSRSIPKTMDVLRGKSQQIKGDRFLSKEFLNPRHRSAAPPSRRTVMSTPNADVGRIVPLNGDSIPRRQSKGLISQSRQQQQQQQQQQQLQESHPQSGMTEQRNQLNISEHFSQLSTLSVHTIDWDDMDDSSTVTNELVLFGRDKEIHILRHAYHRMSQTHNSEVVFLRGISGTGKSSLAESLRLPVTKDNSYFVSAKFDQYTRGSPFAALTAVFSDLCTLVAQTTKLLPPKQRQIRNELGSDIRILNKLISNLDLVTGMDPTVDELDFTMDAYAFARFKIACKKLLKVLAVLPVVLFLDDIHWADRASIEVIRMLIMDPLSRNTLFVVAFREDELDETFHNRLHSIDRSIETIELKNFDREEITSTLMSLFHFDDRSQVWALSKVVFKKTDGNPYFTINYVQELQARSLIRKSQDSRGWEFDIDRIASETVVSENLAEVLASKIHRLDPALQVVLLLASFLGFQFYQQDLELLIGSPDIQNVLFRDQFLQHTLRSLKPSLIKKCLKACKREGVIIRQKSGQYIFSHDRIQQCLYKMAGADKEVLHYGIGMHYFNQGARDNDEKLIQATEHLNQAMSFVEDEETFQRLVQLNQRAARAAIRKVSYFKAAAYSRVALSLIRNKSRNPWETHYTLILPVANKCAEIEYCAGNFKECQEIVDEIMIMASNLDEKTGACFIGVQCLRAQDQLEEAIETGASFLRKLGESFPSAPTSIHVFTRVYKTRKLLRNLSDTDIISLPKLIDKSMIDMVKLLGQTSLYAIITQRQKMVMLGILRVIQISVSHGMSGPSAYAFAMFGAILCVLGNREEGCRYGRLAVELIRKFPQNETYARTLTISHSMVLHLREPLRDCAPSFGKAFECGLASGNIEIAMVAAAAFGSASFFLGKRLDKVAAEMENLHNRLTDFDQTWSLVKITRPYWQIALNLMGKTHQRDILTGPAMNEVELFEESNAAGHQILLFVLLAVKMTACVYFEAWGVARKASTAMEENLALMMRSHFLYLIFQFYEAISCFEVNRLTGDRKLLLQARKTIKSLQSYEKLGCQNMRPYLYALQAESLAAKTECGPAIETAFDQAIVHASNLPHLAALLNERAAKALERSSNSNNTRAIQIYKKHAIESYRRWGATRKAEEVKAYFEGERED